MKKPRSPAQQLWNKYSGDYRLSLAVLALIRNIQYRHGLSDAEPIKNYPDAIREKYRNEKAAQKK